MVGRTVRWNPIEGRTWSERSPQVPVALFRDPGQDRGSQDDDEDSDELVQQQVVAGPSQARTLPSTRRTISPERPRPARPRAETTDEDVDQLASSQEEDGRTPAPAPKAQAKAAPATKKRKAAPFKSQSTSRSQPANKAPRRLHREESKISQSSQESRQPRVIIRLKDEKGEEEKIKLRKGNAYLVITHESELTEDQLDTMSTGLSVGIIEKINEKRTHVKMRWLYRVTDWEVLTEKLSMLYEQLDKRLGTVIGSFELLGSEHRDWIIVEALAEPMTVYLYNDAAREPGDVVKPIGRPHNQDDERDHVVRILDNNKAAIDSAWFMRKSMPAFLSGTADPKGDRPHVSIGHFSSAITLPKHCKCHRPYDPAKEMRRCGKCEKWWHGACTKPSSRVVGDELVIRGGDYGVVGNFGVLDDDDAEGWRSWAKAPRAWVELIDMAQKQKGRLCPGCGATI